MRERRCGAIDAAEVYRRRVTRFGRSEPSSVPFRAAGRPMVFHDGSESMKGRLLCATASVYELGFLAAS